MSMTCLNCGISETEIPLVQLQHRGAIAYICPQCFPLLIHSPQKLAGKIPGIEKIKPVSHE
jgi:hypothetical protein